MVETLERAGCDFRGGIVDGMGGRQALVEDPSGNPVELFEPRRRPAGDATEGSPRGAQAGRDLVEVVPIVHRVEVDLPPERAFELFTDLWAWWPLAYTFAEGRCSAAWVEPRPGGRWLERDEDGRELPWGDVRACEPGRRLVLGFAIGADRQPVPFDRASEIEVRFAPAGGGRSTVEVEHRDLARHGNGAVELRAGMDSPQGWPLILAELRRAAGRRAPAAG
jgi:uncharacterized protein YndB with AHSA1/START domain